MVLIIDLTAVSPVIPLISFIERKKKLLFFLTQDPVQVTCHISLISFNESVPQFLMTLTFLKSQSIYFFRIIYYLE